MRSPKWGKGVNWMATGLLEQFENHWNVIEKHYPNVSEFSISMTFTVPRASKLDKAMQVFQEDNFKVVLMPEEEQLIVCGVHRQPTSGQKGLEHYKAILKELDEDSIKGTIIKVFGAITSDL